MLNTGWDFLFAGAVAVVAALYIKKRAPNIHAHRRAKKAARFLRLEDRGLVQTSPMEYTAHHSACGSRVRTAIDAAGLPQRFCPTCVCKLNQDNSDPRLALPAPLELPAPDPKVVSMVGRKPKYTLKRSSSQETPPTVA